MPPRDSVPQPPSYSRAISAYFYLLVFVLCATLVVAVSLYGEPFLFWEYAFSDLGSTATWGGEVNAASRLVFTLGGFTSGWVMLHIWGAYSGEIRFRNQKMKRNLGLLGMVGLLLGAVPNSQHHITHTIGAIFSFAALYFFTMIFHFELKASMPGWLFYLDVILLQVVVFTYAVAFFSDWPTKQGFQKVALVGVFYDILMAVSVGEEGLHPREVWGVLRGLQG